MKGYEVIIKHIQNGVATDKEIESLLNGIKELEKLAEIGKATELALRNNEYCIASYKGNHLHSVKTVDELLQWAKDK
jgi:hypothetical protein